MDKEIPFQFSWGRGEVALRWALDPTQLKKNKKKGATIIGR